MTYPVQVEFCLSSGTGSLTVRAEVDLSADHTDVRIDDAAGRLNGHSVYWHDHGTVERQLGRVGYQRLVDDCVAAALEIHNRRRPARRRVVWL